MQIKFDPEYCGLSSITMLVTIEEYKSNEKIQNSMYLDLKMDPIYDYLRDDPRFQELIAKYKELYDENLRKYGDIDI